MKNASPKLVTAFELAAKMPVAQVECHTGLDTQFTITKFLRTLEHFTWDDFFFLYFFFEDNEGEQWSGLQKQKNRRAQMSVPTGTTVVLLRCRASAHLHTPSRGGPAHAP